MVCEKKHAGNVFVSELPRKKKIEAHRDELVTEVMIINSEKNH